MSEAENTGAERKMKDFRFASVQSIEQMTRGLGHVVMPLASSLELPHPDLMELIQLGQAVIQERNVREVAERIKERRGATPLAVTVASFMQEFAGPANAREGRELLIGMLFGAYAGARRGQMDEAVAGAVGGAVAVTTYSVLQRMLKEDQDAWEAWSRRTG